MNRIDSITKPLIGFVAILLTVLAAGCGGSSSPILGGGGAGVLTRPRVLGTVPADAAVIAPTNAAITATFTKSMAPATITAAGTFTVTGPGTTLVPGTVTYLVGSNTAIFKSTALTVGVLYTATITTAATDLAGTALAGNQAALPAASKYVWTFTASAADTTPPTITFTSPADLATAVQTNSTVNATFNKAMDPVSVTFTVQASGPPLGTALAGAVSYDPLTYIATFTPTALLATSINYTATVTGNDLAGNALVVPGVVSIVAPINKPNPWTFTTASTAPAPLALNLGTAATYGIAAGAGMTSTGVTVVNGNVALSPTGTCTDATGSPANCLVQFKPASALGLTVNGQIRFPTDSDAGATAAAVKSDLTAAWTEGFNKVDTFATGYLTGQLAGKTLLPGVYDEGALGLAAGGTATFDAQNNANAVFIIKVGTVGGIGDFTDSGTLLLPSKIVLANQAQARNIWFVVGRDITIGHGTAWNGNILAGRDATVLDSSTVTGRVLGGGAPGGAGAIVLTGAASPSVTTITVP